MSPNGDGVCLSSMSTTYMELFSAHDKSFPEEQKDFLLRLLEKSKLPSCASQSSEDITHAKHPEKGTSTSLPIHAYVFSAVRKISGLLDTLFLMVPGEQNK